VGRPPSPGSRGPGPRDRPVARASRSHTECDSRTLAAPPVHHGSARRSPVGDGTGSGRVTVLWESQAAQERSGLLIRRAGKLDPERLWRLPATLSTLALLALSAWSFLDRFASGTFARETLAFVLALGACSMLLGLGLGLWIGVRFRSAPALAAGAWSVLVVLAWWWLVFGPLLRPPAGR